MLVQISFFDSSISPFRLKAVALRKIGPSLSKQHN